MSKWEHLKASVPMLLSMSVVGMSFSGADVPGFFYNPESNELVVRWYQAGAFQPFFRAHAHLDTKRREPWLFDEATKLHIKHAIRMRYTYLPFMYTLFRENSVNGMPIMRPLWFHFPSDSNSFGIDESYLLGEALLVHPVTEKGATSVQIYFPGDKKEVWLDLETNTVYEGGNYHTVAVSLSKIPLFQKGRSIIPRRERVRRSAALTLNDPLSLDIVLDTEAKTASGSLYLDDGSTFNHEKGEFIEASITYNQKVLNYKVTDGKLKTRAWLERVTIYKYPERPTAIEAATGPLRQSLKFKYDAVAKTLVIRKPDLAMGENWEISIK
jgi:alpha 1,3-glucosidase